jgi:hypothetical protein
MKHIQIVLFISLVLAACNQDPIFTMISNEVEPKDPLINGSPSKLVRFDNAIYVANGKLWRYSGGGWSGAGGPSNVYDIAATKDALYLLSVSGSSYTVYKRDSNGQTLQIPNASGYSMIQGIYSNGDDLYAGGSNGSEGYALLELKTNGSLGVKYSIGSPLTGVAGDYYTAGRSGIYRISNNTLVEGSTGYSIAGIIKIDKVNSSGTVSKTIAVSSGGTIFDITGNSATPHETSYSFTGALAEYTPVASTNRKLLLLGIKGSVYNLGYCETWIEGDGAFSLRTPGGSSADSTFPIADRDKYSATLAKCAVNSLIEAGGKSNDWPIVFASTQKNGLWSYRDGEWNAEE